MHTKKLITHYKTHTHTTKLPFLQLLLKSSHTTMMMINSSSSIFMSPNQEQLHPYTSLSIFISEIQMLELLLAGVVFLSLHSLRGGSSFPLVGMLPSLLLGLKTGNIYDWLTEVLASARLRTGRSTFAFRGPPFTNLHCVVTSDPANLEHLLRARFPNFPKGPYFRDTARDLLGRGIFNADGEAWRAQRRAASLHFHSARFRSTTAESLVELVHGRLLPVLESGSGEFDLQEVLLRLTFDNVCAIAFGVDPGCLRAGLPEVAFARAFEAATEGTFARFLRPTAAWKAMRWAGAGGEGRLREAIEGVDEFASGVIEERRRRKKGGDREGADLLTVMMMKGGDEEMYYSERMMRDVCVNLILAGRDTSSVALSWFFWLLDGNREAEERILEEIRGIVREREEEEEQQQEEELVFRAEEVKKMDYLHAALSEALRLYPSVPVDHKEVLEDDEFPDGTILKKGTKVVYAIYAMGRMESIWGKDCRDFKPERWLRDGRFVSESAYKFAAFNAGPRLCLGKDFAYYQMKFVAASILYRYRVEVVRDHPVVPKMALTMYMKYGLKVELKKRQLN